MSPAIDAPRFTERVPKDALRLGLLRRVQALEAALELLTRRVTTLEGHAEPTPEPGRTP